MKAIWVVAAAAMTLAACEKTTVVPAPSSGSNTSTKEVVKEREVVQAPTPGPPGPQGAPGPEGPKGESGGSNTTVVVPPPAEKK